MQDALRGVQWKSIHCVCCLWLCGCWFEGRCVYSFNWGIRRRCAPWIGCCGLMMDASNDAAYVTGLTNHRNHHLHDCTAGGRGGAADIDSSCRIQWCVCAGVEWVDGRLGEWLRQQVVLRVLCCCAYALRRRVHTQRLRRRAHPYHPCRPPDATAHGCGRSFHLKGSPRSRALPCRTPDGGGGGEEMEGNGGGSQPQQLSLGAPSTILPNQAERRR